MRKNPGRKQKRYRIKKKGDLNRKSTHIMRSKMYMGSKQRVEPAPSNRLVAWLKKLKQWLFRLIRRRG